MSPLITPNTSEKVDFGPIEEGVYPTKLNEITVEMSQKGNRMVVVKQSVRASDTVTKDRTGYHVISGKGSSAFDSLLRACGFEKEADEFADPSIPESDKTPFDTDQLLGMEPLVDIRADVDLKGRPSDKIQGYLKP